ncbi:DUF2314 domain-containing protein [Bremerella sp. JC770]|uniref:DUF2314 domain-containing protein n=1 Tax=Bremerella sp. JC770 TaxID=3232137 RepID=UPI003459B004
MRAMLLIGFWVLLITGCTSQPAASAPDASRQGDAELAMDAAQANLDQFINAIESGDGQDFAVQTFIDEEGSTKNFWVTGVTLDSDQFTGTVEEGVASLQTGQQWTVAKGDVLDWKYLRNDQVIRPSTQASE